MITYLNIKVKPVPYIYICRVAQAIACVFFLTLKTCNLGLLSIQVEYHVGIKVHQMITVNRKEFKMFI